MKSISLVFVVLAATISVRADVLASYHFGHINAADPSYSSYNVYDVSLQDDKSLTIRKTTRVKGQMQPGLVEAQQIPLSDAAFANLHNQVLNLHDEPIIQQAHQFVCDMMPPPWADNEQLQVLQGDYDAQSGNIENGKLVTVMGPQGCWLASATVPKDAFALTQAQQLEKSLVLMTEQFSN